MRSFSLKRISRSEEPFQTESVEAHNINEVIKY